MDLTLYLRCAIFLNEHIRCLFKNGLSTFQCNGTSCYEESVLIKSLCTPSFYRIGKDFITVGVKFPSKLNMHAFISIIGFICWALLVGLSILESFIQKKETVLTSFDDKLALGMAAAIFSGTLVALYIDQFDIKNFCLMNNNDYMCKNKKLSCFTMLTTCTRNFGFGGFIEVGRSGAG